MRIRKAKVIILVRHGQTDWNKKDLYQGLADIPLNKEGRKQAFLLAKKFTSWNPDLILTSPLKRARETAEIVAQGRIPIVMNKNLVERNFGQLEGLNLRKAKELFPKIKFLKEYNTRFLFSLPGGENLQDFQRRAQRVVRELGRFQDKKILIVSHAIFLEMLYSILTKQDFQKCVGRFDDLIHFEVLHRSYT
jgi:broad specificity phosphatase PhoE